MNIALVTADREIELLDSSGGRTALTSVPDGVMWGNWATMGEASTYSWPTFSPDGRSIACFKGIGRAKASVWVTDLEGVVSSDVIDLTGRVPIYLQWSLDSRRIAAVSQEGNELQLSACAVDDHTTTKLLAKGSPLFFTWTEDGLVAAFIGGGSRDARMVLLDPRVKLPPQILPGMPGDFCAPVRTIAGVTYASHNAGQAEILGFRPGATQTFSGGDGLLAFVPSPDGRYLARACAPHGDGTPYQSLSVLDLEEGTERTIADLELLAFMWTPDGKGLVVSRVDRDRSLIEWSYLDLYGNKRPLVDLIPTPDMQFYLRFFEQYTQSHPLIDPTSSSLLVAGVVRGRGTKRRVWRVSLHGGPLEELGEGMFAVYGPPPLN